MTPPETPARAETPLDLNELAGRTIQQIVALVDNRPYVDLESLAVERIVLAALQEAARSTLEVEATWTPTADHVNALLDPVRQYIHQLETVCDPAGDQRALVLLRDENAMLRAKLAEMTSASAPLDLGDWRILRARQWDWHDQHLIVQPFVDRLIMEVENLRRQLAENAEAARSLRPSSPAIFSCETVQGDGIPAAPSGAPDWLALSSPLRPSSPALVEQIDEYFFKPNLWHENKMEANALLRKCRDVLASSSGSPRQTERPEE
jgi:hypothetical protein